MAQEDLPFARDLGYLDKFLKTLATHAESMPEPQRAELLRLVAAEAAHWDRIKALLSGNAASAPAAAPVASAALVSAAPRGLTVGSLMSRP